MAQDGPALPGQEIADINAHNQPDLAVSQHESPSSQEEIGKRQVVPERGSAILLSSAGGAGRPGKALDLQRLPQRETESAAPQQSPANPGAASPGQGSPATAAPALQRVAEQTKARQRLLDDSLNDKHLYTDIADDSDLEIGNEIHILDEIKQKRLELFRIIKRKEKKAKVLFANLKVHGRVNNIVRNPYKERLATPVTKEATKRDAVKVFSEKLKRQLALGRPAGGQGNVALNLIMNLQKSIQSPPVRNRGASPGLNLM